jgi:hypothetical protein
MQRYSTRNLIISITIYRVITKELNTLKKIRAKIGYSKGLQTGWPGFNSKQVQ